MSTTRTIYNTELRAKILEVMAEHGPATAAGVVKHMPGLDRRNVGRCLREGVGVVFETLPAAPGAYRPLRSQQGGEES